MNFRSFPMVPTIVVLLAAATMIKLGFWQLDRADEKEALLASYAAVPDDAGPVDYPLDEASLASSLYRSTSVNCTAVLGTRDGAGTNTVGAKGWAHIAKCRLENGTEAEVAMGWSRDPNGPEWVGGKVTGTIAPGGKIVASPPLADLGPLARPDPADLPNNHLSYAVQWFLFAATALVIFVLAVYRRANPAD